MAGSKIPYDTSPDVLENLLRYDESLRSEAQLRALRKKYGLDPATGVAAPGLLAPGARLNGDHPYWQAHPGQMTAAKVGMLPFRMGAGLVESGMQALTAPGRVMRGQVPERDYLPEAMNFAGNVMGGSVTQPRPKSSIGMGGHGKDAITEGQLSAAKSGKTVEHATDFKASPVEVQLGEGMVVPHPYLQKAGKVEFTVHGMPDDVVFLDWFTHLPIDTETPLGYAQYFKGLNGWSPDAAIAAAKQELKQMAGWSGDAATLTNEALKLLEDTNKIVHTPIMGWQPPGKGSYEVLPNTVQMQIYKLLEDGAGNLSGNEVKYLVDTYEKTTKELSAMDGMDYSKKQDAFDQAIADKFKHQVLPNTKYAKIADAMAAEKFASPATEKVPDGDPPPSLAKSSAPLTADKLPEALEWVDWDGNTVSKQTPEGLAKINAHLAGSDQGLVAVHGPSGEMVENLGKILQKAQDGVPGYKLYMQTASGVHGGVKPQPAKQGLPGMSPEEINPAAYTTLPMDRESVLARAKELGYNTDQVVYHGMPKYEGRRWNGLGFNRSESKNEGGLFTTTEPRIANSYANSPETAKDVMHYDLSQAQGQNVVPMYGRADNPKVVDWKGGSYGPSRMINDIDAAWAAGHDMLRIDNMHDVGGKQSQLIYRYPEQLRSIHAVFDPAYRNSPNLLRAGAGPAGQTLGSAAGQNSETWNFLRGGDPTAMGNRPDEKKSKKREPLRITVTPRKVEDDAETK